MRFLQAIKQRQEAVAQRKNTNRANKLTSLRAKRIKLEGQTKIIKLEQKEKSRIKKAKDIKKANRNPLLLKLGDNIKKNAANNKNSNPMRGGELNPIFHSTGKNSNTSFLPDNNKKNKGGKGIFF
jgi:hypothetical protein